MAGIEQLEIHSKSYLLRWVRVEEGQTLSWSLQPSKKSLNFGIVKHPGLATSDLVSEAGEETNTRNFRRDKDGSTAQEQLAAKGFRPITWQGRCEADKVTVGTVDVGPGQAGMYGLVFDNTFSKQTAKTATFVMLLYPTGLPPQSVQNVAPNAMNPATPASRTGPPPSSAGKHAAQSADNLNLSIPQQPSLPSRAATMRPIGDSDATLAPNTYHVGILLKRRRRRGQGFARRFFSLDFSSCTLSYYYNRTSSKLRGSIPLSLAAIAADERRREITIDSGAEIWHLRASSYKDFADWTRALQKANRISRGIETGLDTSQQGALQAVGQVSASATPQNLADAAPTNMREVEDKEWQQIEILVSRLVGTRDALRRLTQDATNKDTSVGHAPTQPAFQPPAALGRTPTTDGANGSDDRGRRPPFWRRMTSNSSAITQSQTSHTPVPTLNNATATADRMQGRKRSQGTGYQESGLQEHCVSILGDLESVVADFAQLLNSSKRRRASLLVEQANLQNAPTLNRISTISEDSSDEFFDAEAGNESTTNRLMMIDRSEPDDEGGDDDEPSDVDEGSIHDASSSSDDEEPADPHAGLNVHGAALYPVAAPPNLAPLPLADIVIQRRKTIPPAKMLPPSLIGFVRKNIGKDLSTISMPVSANEPLSLLQRVAEQLEYSEMLDTAAQHQSEVDRLLFVAAFAMSQYSVSRCKERAMRKPFNPLLGETFEYVRADHENGSGTGRSGGGFRLLVEKVTHRPAVRLAMHAESTRWSFSQSPAPSQKFWGKSMELTTDGRVRVVLRLPGADNTAVATAELYSWPIGAMFLRNVVMGEKYIEPVGNVHVVNDSTGARATIEFRARSGMFGGRAEDVHIDVYPSTPTGVSATPAASAAGSWTSSLRRLDGSGELLWQVGSLVDKAPATYGLTTFAAGLNEITEVERNRLPPTDSRLRPDQRAAEQGSLDEAETWKARLEDSQRRRRRELEERGLEHVPRWFECVAPAGRAGASAGAGVESGADSEVVWKIKTGKDSYWEQRARGEWTGIQEIFLE